MEKSRVLTVLFLVLFLNLLWEFSHYSLYYDFLSIEKFPRLILASFGDLALISLMFLLVSLTNRNISWIQNPSKSDYALLAVLGIAIAILVEVNALSRGDWAYKKEMPTILGIGLSPLVQLAVTSIAALMIQNRN